MVSQSKDLEAQRDESSCCSSFLQADTRESWALVSQSIEEPSTSPTTPSKQKQKNEQIRKWKEGACKDKHNWMRWVF